MDRARGLTADFLKMVEDIKQCHCTHGDIGQKQEEYEAACNVCRSLQNNAEPERMWMAADYSDQWFARTHSQLNVYYMCKSGVAPGCLTDQRSKEWTRLEDDMTGLETGQMWYCKECGAEHATRFGVLVEMVMDRE